VTVVFRASDKSAAERLEYMRQALAESVVPFDLRQEDEANFSAEIRTTDVGVVRIVDIDAPTSEAVRTRRLIRRSDPEVCTIHLQLRGHPVVEQDDRQVQVYPGDLTFVDLSRPTRVAGAAHRQVSVMFPRALLLLSREDTRRLAGVGISGRDGTGALVGGLVRRMAREPDRYAGASAARIGTAVLDLTTAMLASQLGREAEAPPPPRHVLLLRVQAFIEERLGDPALSPGMIAAANHISLRYLHKLFEPQSRTWGASSANAGWSAAAATSPTPASPTSPCGPSRCATGSRTRPGSIGCSRMSMVSRPASTGGCASEDNDRARGDYASPHAVRQY
jgi:hypothetical protein